MPTDTYRTEHGTIGTRHVKSDADIASAQATSRLTDTSRLGSLGTKGRGPMPKQGDYASTAAYATALRQWREASGPEVEGQKKALQRLGAK